MNRTIRDFQHMTGPQLTLLAHLEESPDFTSHFYLTGGTLLKALDIVPRQSNDLDFFTFANIEPRGFLAAQAHVRSILEKTFGSTDITLTDKGFLHTESSMVIDLVADSTPNIGEFQTFGALHTASLEDVAAHKASAVCSRDEIKDYIDIAFLTKHKNWLLRDLAALAEQKFRLGTISEEKLLTELLAKRESFSIPATIFLKAADENTLLVTKQIDYLIEQTTL